MVDRLDDKPKLKESCHAVLTLLVLTHDFRTALLAGTKAGLGARSLTASIAGGLIVAVASLMQ